MKRQVHRKWAGQSVARSQLSRRTFLTSSAAAVVAPMVVPASALGRDGHLPPSERINIGMIGVGNRGMNSLLSMRSLPDQQVLAIADCRRERALHAQQFVNEMYAKRLNRSQSDGCQIYNDFRELLAREDIDAVWGCVPDHWHGIVFSRAIEAGKDIYGEKPLTRYIAESVKVRDAVRRYGTVFQTGTQQRSGTQFRQACELATNGYLGKVHTIHVGAPAGEAYPAITPSAPPPGFDYDMWTGPAPLIPFDTNRCEWLAMYMISHYCAGFITNWGVHYLDIAGWGCPEVFEQPFSAEGTGVLPTEGMTDTWISWKMKLEWASGLKMDYKSAVHPDEMGCKFVGDEGWVRVERGGIYAEPASLLSVAFKPTDTPLHRSPICADDPDNYVAHTADFFRSIRTRQDPVSPVESGHAASTIGNVCDIALRLNRKLKWDPSNDRFVGDDDANRLRSRPFRAPWAI